MIDHLPECSHSLPVASPMDFHLGTTDCICDRLRACEQRVLDDVLPDVRYAAFEAGVQAARDAVAALDYPHLGAPAVIQLPQALAAIDALRGESHD